MLVWEEDMVKALREENARLHELGSVKSALRLQDERQELVKTKLALRRRVEELEREKYGTPCRCEQWVKACGEAEQRVEELERELEENNLTAISHWRRAEAAEKRVEVLEQTTGDLCDSCGWRTVIAGTCVKCACRFSPIDGLFDHLVEMTEE